MQIDPTQHKPHISPTETREVKKTSEVRPSDPTTSASTRFEPSGLSDTSQDVDIARVNQITQAIKDGQFEVNANRIADGLISSANALASGTS